MISSMNSKQTGVTLVELVMAIVIISISMATLLGFFANNVSRSADGIGQTRQMALAELYLDEVLSKKFDHATGNGGSPVYNGCRITNDGESRVDYNDVDDFNGLNETPQFIDTALATIYSQYSVSITVTCDTSHLLSNKGQAKRITITVNGPNNTPYKVSVFKGNY